MKLIKPSFEILEQTPGIQGVKKQIELAGRTCYKSEDKITDTSCEEFVSRMVNSGHGAMLEHGTVYLKIPYQYIDVSSKLEIPIMEDSVAKYTANNYSKCITMNNIAYITTNYRVLVENGWLDDLQYQCEPTEHHEKRITVKFICDRGVSHEFVRHRVFSFAQESTRYCNYSRKDKFNEEIKCIIPSWTTHLFSNNSYDTDLLSRYVIRITEEIPNIEYILIKSWCEAENAYFHLLEQGYTAQQARAVLPTALKTELVMTGFVSDWEHFFKLRCHSTAHPQARELAIPLKDKFIELNLID
jgi:thymidylate synthase (FAD)